MSDTDSSVVEINNSDSNSNSADDSDEDSSVLEEEKKYLCNYYNEAFHKKSNEIFVRVFSVFSYDAMQEFGENAAKLREMWNSKEDVIKDMQKNADLDFERKRCALTQKYGKRIEN